MTRHITVPLGFRAAGVACGIKPSGNEDLALLAGQGPLAAAMVATRNQIVGAPVQYCRSILPRGTGRVRGVVINAGNSNVCTGRAGLKDAERMARLAGEQIGCGPGEVLVASTGIIGQRLPMDRVRVGIAEAGERLARRDDRAFLRAIMTTDTREKSAVIQTRLNGKPVTVAGVVKGSGMIAPSLATMIAVLTTDAAVSPTLLGKALREVAGETFNAVTVDSDTSTSDTVFLLASGAARNRPLKKDQPAWRTFLAALGEVCGELARAIVLDGEGATRLIEVRVRNAASAVAARAAAMSVANSPLVKTAVHGCDPNWGRVAMALGKSSARVVAGKLRICIAGNTVFARGIPTRFDPAAVSRAMQDQTVVIDCSLGLGSGEFTALTCDLSREYIAINADYHT
jgi:glutamate N-acetyltransferase / amino-acid N-acetyltransferase